MQLNYHCILINLLFTKQKKSNPEALKARATADLTESHITKDGKRHTSRDLFPTVFFLLAQKIVMKFCLAKCRSKEKAIQIHWCIMMSGKLLHGMVWRRMVSANLRDFLNFFCRCQRQIFNRQRNCKHCTKRRRNYNCGSRWSIGSNEFGIFIYFILAAFS